MEVKIKILEADAMPPKYAKDGNAGMDIIATRIINENIFQIRFGTGIAIEIPEGYVGLVFPRSSIRNYDMNMSNSVGIIDSTYRGEIQVTFNKLDVDHNECSDEYYQIGDKVAQLIIMPYPKIEFKVVEELSSTERGHNGHGSTGK